MTKRFAVSLFFLVQEITRKRPKSNLEPHWLKPRDSPTTTSSFSNSSMVGQFLRSSRVLNSMVSTVPDLMDSKSSIWVPLNLRRYMCSVGDT